MFPGVMSAAYDVRSSPSFRMHRLLGEDSGCLALHAKAFPLYVALDRRTRMLAFSSELPWGAPLVDAHHSRARGLPPSQEQDSIRYMLLRVAYAEHFGSPGGSTEHTGKTGQIISSFVFCA